MKYPRMNLHVGDYHQRTRHLRAAEHGAFHQLILHYWSTGGLPQEDKQLATIACMDMREWKKAKSVIQALFEANWRLPWLDADLKDAAASRERRVKAGQAGNKKRWGSDRHAYADARSFGDSSEGDRNANASGSLPHASPHGSEPEQGKTYIEEGSVIEADVVPFRRETA